MKKIQALTFDTRLDSWERSRGFVKREIAMPKLDERKEPKDAVSVLIEVKYAGVCGTDRGIWNREVFRELIYSSLKRETLRQIRQAHCKQAQGKKTQRILGHEFVGKVVQAGSQVNNLYGIRVGDNVSGDSHITCGRCFQCRVGEEEVCQDQAILGIATDGVFAKYIKIPAKNLWQVDFTRIRPEIGAILDPFGNAVHACSKADLRGKRVAILGCGPIGMFTILLARAFGAVKVIAVNTSKPNLVMAKRLGAHEVISVSPRKGGGEYRADKSLRKTIDKFTYSKGVDVAFEMAGSNDSLNNALAITRSGGDVVLFGLKDGDFVLPDFSKIIVGGLTLHGVIGRQLFTTWQTSQRMLSDRQNGIQDKIWRVILKNGKDTIMPLSQYTPEKFENKMKKHPKILIKM